ncbi:hypothetical protein J6590_011086 [Homalodisca vitripennis]|nr:hypothetical protein J6590_011086 [Homalodisca vitripennis]
MPSCLCQEQREAKVHPCATPPKESRLILGGCINTYARSDHVVSSTISRLTSPLLSSREVHGRSYVHRLQQPPPGSKSLPADCFFGTHLVVENSCLGPPNKQWGTEEVSTAVVRCQVTLRLRNSSVTLVYQRSGLGAGLPGTIASQARAVTRTTPYYAIAQACTFGEHRNLDM